MTWHLLEKYVDTVTKRSTVIAKIWITCLYIFRVISVNRIAESLYADEQSAFKCNTRQPGCENMCFNEFSPISHSRFWGFQIIITFAPMLLYITYTVEIVKDLPIPKKLKRRNMRNRRQQLIDYERKRRQCTAHQSQSNRESQNHYQNERGNESVVCSLDNSILSETFPGTSLRVSTTTSEQPTTLPLCDHYPMTSSIEIQANEHDGAVIPLPDFAVNAPSDGQKVVNEVDELEQSFEMAYRFVCLATILLETVFLVLQIGAFGFVVPEQYKCDVYPCPTVVDCFTSRPGEKSSVLKFMFFVTLLCIVLCLLEMISLPKSRKREVLDLLRLVKKVCCLPTTNMYSIRGGGSCDGKSDEGENSWYILERMMNDSDDSQSSGSSDSDDTDKSVDSAELDEMYEQDGDLAAEMETQDVDQGNDDDCN